MKRTRLIAAVLTVALSACSSMRGPTHQVAAAPPPPPPSPDSTDNPAPPPPEEPSPPDTSEENSQPSGAAPVIPLCVPAETKSKPKPKPKPKPVRKEAPPQMPTAPAVAETPPGGVVDAQIRPMPVSVMSILGKRVQGAKGEDLGRVVDVLADASGRVRIAIIDFGGFLGVGDRRIAVDWPLLRFNPDARDPSLLLSLSREKLKSAPEYKDNPRPQTLMEPAPTPASAPAPAPEVPTPTDHKK
jgi:hypothetical protein